MQGAHRPVSPPRIRQDHFPKTLDDSSRFITCFRFLRSRSTHLNLFFRRLNYAPGC